MIQSNKEHNTTKMQVKSAVIALLGATMVSAATSNLTRGAGSVNSTSVGSNGTVGSSGKNSTGIRSDSGASLISGGVLGAVIAAAGASLLF